jgi:hypothetical protein
MRASSGAHVPLRFICPAPRGIGERLGSAGFDISTSGSAHTLVFRSLKPPTDGKEHTVLFVGADEDRGSFTDFPTRDPLRLSLELRRLFSSLSAFMTPGILSPITCTSL